MRPLSPLVDTSVIDVENNNIKTPTIEVVSPVRKERDEVFEKKTDSNEEIPSPRKSPDTGEFRARAASAGQQARAHVSQIVARFRNRSNTNSDEKQGKRYRIVGHVSI